MTQREKMLAGTVGLAAGIYFGYVAIQKLIIEPNRQINQQINAALEYRDKLEMRLNGSDKTIEEWYAETGRTLSENYFDAHLAFREDVGSLLKRNHLSDQLKIAKSQEHSEKKWPRAGFIELPVTVSVNGTLPDLDNFLKDFFQRPYMVRMEKLELSASHTSAARAKRGAKTETEPQLTIRMTVSTLILPQQDGREHPTFDLARLENPDPEEDMQLVSADRLRHDSEEYNDITANNLFVKWTPPPPPPPPQVEKPVEVVRETPKHHNPPPPPPPTNDNLVVEGVARLADGPIVYVVDTDAPGRPPKEYRLNDELDGGRVVLIVPEGIVINIPPKRGQQTPPENYYYPLGESFADRVEVSAEEHPAIARYLEIVLNDH